MKTYAFKVIVEPDEDCWQARCPALRAHGAATWGHTEEEAYKHIHEVVEMIVHELNEDGIAIPESPNPTFAGRMRFEAKSAQRGA